MITQQVLKINGLTWIIRTITNADGTRTTTRNLLK